MKNIFIVLSILCFFGFTVTIQIQDDQKEDFEWLLGDWKRTNEKEGLQTFESWKKLNNDHYAGSGFTLKKRDTVWQESINLKKEKGVWNYKVKLERASQETVFRVTSIEKLGFTCENERNDFPKKISYKKGENGLIVVLSGDNQEVLFQFVKRK